jgi:metal-sulfur cluster biosynthetic enzyme
VPSGGWREWILVLTGVTRPMSGSTDNLLPVVSIDAATCTKEPAHAGHSHGEGCCSHPPVEGAIPVASACSPLPPGAELLNADEEQMIEALRSVIDPELFINIVDLGLVYTINQGDEGKVHVEMTLTSPSCPAGPQIVHQAKTALEQLPGVTEAKIRLVMSPPWTPARMTDDARDKLGIF